MNKIKWALWNFLDSHSRLWDLIESTKAGKRFLSLAWFEVK